MYCVIKGILWLHHRELKIFVSSFFLKKKNNTNECSEEAFLSGHAESQV